ncbi:phosphatidylethanolamine-binding protein [Dendryphion nanum]|uniref:Large ribosomal subunit protein mL38 n=1 Tax=Dendryphion nanum TaxID=256645 RepID=A0A9P9E8L7_9PLEO|nr:phosphatidylethanolamine-binding protein [Dendryphion nanum]
MASVKPSLRQISTCLRCVRQPTAANGSFNGYSSQRLFSTSMTVQEEIRTEPTTTSQPSAPPLASAPSAASSELSEGFKPEFMQKWGLLDPNLVEGKRDERRLIRREGVQPIGSRRRRAVLRRSTLRQTPQVPFEQLPYQCFQEARKFLLEDRQEKLDQIKAQNLRIQTISAQDPSISGNPGAKELRLKGMREHLNELVILADINDPIVKKNFEDGIGDMNKPIYRYLANEKWRKYKRLVLQQRLTQMYIVPDLLPSLDPIVDIDLGFGRLNIAPGDFVASNISEKLPRLNVQSFEAGEKLVSVVVVDADVPDPSKDSFTTRCHFIASNIPISPTQTSVALTKLEHQDRKATDPAAKHIGLPWIAPWAHKGAPYHRLAVFVLEQGNGKALDVGVVANIKRDGFKVRRFVDKYSLKPLGATLFRTKWDETMAGVMERAGLGDQVNVEMKRKRVEPLPFKRRTERMR